MNIASTSRYIGYYRVSTAKQGRCGLGLEAQRCAVQTYLKDGKLISEFTEVECGHHTDRPKLTEALAACRIHKATLVIAKLERLARNTAFVANLMEAGVDFVAVDFPEANKLTVHINALGIAKGLWEESHIKSALVINASTSEADIDVLEE
jgi:hypothetical protein